MYAVEITFRTGFSHSQKKGGLTCKWLKFSLAFQLIWLVKYGGVMFLLAATTYSYCVAQDIYYATFIYADNVFFVCVCTVTKKEKEIYASSYG